MAREIKFRGKATDDRYGWVYGYLEIFRNAMGRDTAVIHSFSDWNLNMRTEVHIDSVGEFTGIRDKNKKEIYEGDILQYDESEDMSHWVSGQKSLVVFLPGRFVSRMEPFDKEVTGNQNKMTEEFEDCVSVIGNTYDNPEILK